MTTRRLDQEVFDLPVEKMQAGWYTDAYFNPVTELVVGEGAKLEYMCEQNISEHSWLLGSQRSQIGRDAALHWIGLGFGSVVSHQSRTSWP